LGARRDEKISTNQKRVNSVGGKGSGVNSISPVLDVAGTIKATPQGSVQAISERIQRNKTRLGRENRRARRTVLVVESLPRVLGCTGLKNGGGKIFCPRATWTDESGKDSFFNVGRGLGLMVACIFIVVVVDGTALWGEGRVFVKTCRLQRKGTRKRHFNRKAGESGHQKE